MTVHLSDISDDIRKASAPFGYVRVERLPGIYRNGLKRAADMLLVAATGILVVPVVLILALMVARDGHSPFYWSERVGRNGRNFRMMKLRTMVPNADKLLEEYLSTDPEARAEWDSTQKLKRDPRITAVGRFLRKTSIDELPQLWNVFKGEMSIVGPRPMLPSQRVLYPGLDYYALRPGITGPWQVSDRNECEFAKRADFDRDYNRSLSLGNDISLVAKTFGVVLKATGY